MEHSQFDITFLPRTAMKGQALADFIVEFLRPTIVLNPAKRMIYVDGSSSSSESGVGVVLITLDGNMLEHASCLASPATHNIAEYEAVILGLTIARECRA